MAVRTLEAFPFLGRRQLAGQGVAREEAWTKGNRLVAVGWKGVHREWNIWKCELHQISSCVARGSLKPPNDP
jgi:hypothetical protein